MVSDNEFLELLDKYSYSFKIGKIIEGVVVGFEGNNLLVDINAKATAICPSYEILYTENQTTKEMFELNKTYEFVIKSQEDEDGIYYLSHRKVALSRNIEIIEEKFKNNEVVMGIISAIVKGGVIVNVMGIKGFVPSSQLKINDEKIGQVIELKVLALDMTQNNFILSNKKVYSDSLEDVKKDILEKIELNMVVKGKVVRIADFGAFVDIGGIDGLLPLSQISWKWIDNPKDVLTLDETINVEIIGIDKEKQRISLSLKSLEENPWLSAKEVLENNKIVQGKVTRIKSFGAFIEVCENVEGLLNRKQMDEYFAKYQKELKEDEKIEVIIKKFNPDNQKINLEIV